MLSNLQSSIQFTLAQVFIAKRLLVYLLTASDTNEKLPLPRWERSLQLSSQAEWLKNCQMLYSRILYQSFIDFKAGRIYGTFSLPIFNLVERKASSLGLEGSAGRQRLIAAFLRFSYRMYSCRYLLSQFFLRIEQLRTFLSCLDQRGSLAQQRAKCEREYIWQSDGTLWILEGVEQEGGSRLAFKGFGVQKQKGKVRGVSSQGEEESMAYMEQNYYRGVIKVNNQLQ